MTQEQPHHPFETGPFLTAAVLCERVLDEKDGVKSLIRMVDRVTMNLVGPTPPDQIVPVLVNLVLFVSFKSGRARGAMPLTIRIDKPSSDVPPPLMTELHFEGDDDRGQNVIVPLQFNLDVAGLWWFRIELDGIRLTSVPLRVIYLRQQQVGPANGGGHPG